MSNVPSTDNSSESTQDSTLGTRRLVAFIISIVLGTATIGIGEIVLLHTNLAAAFPIAFIPEVPLLPLASIPMSFFFLIWIDYFMGTKIVVD
ncbi:MAG: hypothetical protein ABI947_06135 [Chloroflexota bacterium]